MINPPQTKIDAVDERLCIYMLDLNVGKLINFILYMNISTIIATCE